MGWSRKDGIILRKVKESLHLKINIKTHKSLMSINNILKCPNNTTCPFTLPSFKDTAHSNFGMEL